MAYYHSHPVDPSKTIGYLRIPHYMPDYDGLGEDDPFVARFDQYEYAVSELEAHTDGLIIDQDHNCGGSVFYLEQMVGLFAETSYEQVQFELLATRVEALNFQTWVDMLDERTLLYRDIKQVRGLRQRPICLSKERD